MKKTIIALVAFAAALSINYAQNAPSEYEKVQAVYQSLEYNTIAFNDLKQKWIVSDPLLIREVFNRFIVRDAMRISGARPTLQTVKEKTEFIQNSTVVIDVQKRFYDDEIEFFAFIPESELQKKDPAYLADPVKDPFLLRDILGEKTYEKIRTQGYFFSSLTKTNYDSKNGYYYDLYLNALEPRVMYWNTTSGGRNKYCLSLFGKWGNDFVAIPGWYSGEYVSGVGLTYYKSISSNPDNYTYDIRVGTAMEAGRPFVADVNSKKWLSTTGQVFYGKVSGDFLKYIIDGTEGWDIFLETKYTLNQYKVRDFALPKRDTVYSNRDYFLIGTKVKSLYDFGDIGILEAGGGISISDIYRFDVNPKQTKIIDLDGSKGFMSKFRLGLFFEVGVARTGGLLQHHISVISMIDTKGFGAMGVRGQYMVSDQLGVDIRFMQAFGLDTPTKVWRPDTYIVFSPILRINY